MHGQPLGNVAAGESLANMTACADVQQVLLLTLEVQVHAAVLSMPRKCLHGPEAVN